MRMILLTPKEWSFAFHKRLLVAGRYPPSWWESPAPSFVLPILNDHSSQSFSTTLPPSSAISPSNKSDTRAGLSFPKQAHILHLIAASTSDVALCYTAVLGALCVFGDPVVRLFKLQYGVEKASSKIRPPD
ncbi:hypothetical protein N7527_011766 [Penicillium freii]|nr:hypothetical protein N7527_011766 [Penicillium freii]